MSVGTILKGKTHLCLPSGNGTTRDNSIIYSTSVGPLLFTALLTLLLFVPVFSGGPQDQGGEGCGVGQTNRSFEEEK